MFAEGLLLQKVPFKERDLIVKLLLRSGMVASFYIYGGQGGGKKMKPQLFEVGHLLRCQVTTRHQGQTQELLTVSDYELLWASKHIRHDFKAFSLMCLYLEIILKLAVPTSILEEGSKEYQGLFNVLSNALFYLDHSLEQKQSQPFSHLSLFLVKLLHHLGLTPELSECVHCGADLDTVHATGLVIESGGFACDECLYANQLPYIEETRHILRAGIATRYQQYADFTFHRAPPAQELVRFLGHHFQLKAIDFASYRLLF